MVLSFSNLKIVLIASALLLPGTSFAQYDYYNNDPVEYSAPTKSTQAAPTVSESPKTQVSTKVVETSNSGFEPTYIFGIGGGWHQYENVDEIRKDDDPRFSQNHDVTFAFVRDYFVEWYFNSFFAIGLRYMALESKRIHVDVENDTAKDETWLIENRFLTGTFLLTQAEENRFGVTLGGGGVDYRYHEDSKDGTNKEYEYSKQNNRVGFSYLAGLFYDYGSKGLGLRLGLNYIKNDLDDAIIERERVGRLRPRLTKKIDGSGFNFIINLRLAL